MVSLSGYASKVRALMCGRFTLKTPPSQWSQLLLPVIDSDPLWAKWQPRYNVAPTQSIVVIASRTDGASAQVSQQASQQEFQPHFAWQRWGLVPGWASDISIGSRMINARRETLREKKSFVGPLQKRRCLIVADGYYEWQKADDGSKQPYWIAPENGGMLQLAGLWEVNTRVGPSPLASCAIITTAATASLDAIHDRMPVILTGDAAADWLSPQCDADEAYALLEPVSATTELHPQAVNTYVNNARHEGPECLARQS